MLLQEKSKSRILQLYKIKVSNAFQVYQRKNVDTMIQELINNKTHILRRSRAMTIKKMNGKFYLLSDEGYILHSENTLENMWNWCNEYFAYSVSIGKIKEA